MLRVILVCRLNDNTVYERFKYQCSIDVKNTTFQAYTRYQVDYLYLFRCTLSSYKFLAVFKPSEVAEKVE